MYFQDFIGKELKGVQVQENQVALSFGDTAFIVNIGDGGAHLHVMGVDLPIHPQTRMHPIMMTCQGILREPLPMFTPMLPPSPHILDHHRN